MVVVNDDDDSDLVVVVVVLMMDMAVEATDYGGGERGRKGATVMLRLCENSLHPPSFRQQQR